MLKDFSPEDDFLISFNVPSLSPYMAVVTRENTFVTSTLLDRIIG